MKTPELNSLLGLLAEGQVFSQNRENDHRILAGWAGAVASAAGVSYRIAGIDRPTASNSKRSAKNGQGDAVTENSASERKVAAGAPAKANV